MATTVFPTIGNQKWTYLAEDVDAGETAIDVSSAVALGVSGLTGTAYAWAVIVSISTFGKNPTITPETFEIVKITAVSGNTLTVTRAQQGTSALAFTTGDPILLRVTASNVQEIVDALTLGTSGGNISLNDLTFGNDLVRGASGTDKTWVWNLVPNLATFGAITTTPATGPTSDTNTNVFNAHHNYLSFPFHASNTSYAYWQVPMPAGYDGSALKVTINWYPDTGSVGETMQWGVRAVCIGDGDAVIVATGGVQTADDTLLTSPTTVLHTAPAITITPSNAADGNLMVIGIERKVFGTHGGTCRFVSARVEYA